jgi:tRNA-dihydrouridine synthase C
MWLSYLKRTWPQAAELHAAIRRLQDSNEILCVIEGALPCKDSVRAHESAVLGLLDPATLGHLTGCTLAAAVQ